LELKGTKLDGTELDWTAYRGKVVLVDFCETQSPAWRAEFSNVRKNYQLLHDRGFDVVWVSSDSDRRALEQFFEAEEPAWGVTLHEQGAHAKHPMAAHYGVTSFPTALLVDKQGRVVSLRAYGEELDEQLAKLLGPPFAPKGELTYIELQSKANRKLAETWSGGPGNDLSELPRGEQTFAGVKFKIGEGMIQLGSRQRPDAPEKVAGIEVNRTVARLYILQSMEWGASGVPEGAFVGRYEVRFEDQSTEKIYIVKGQDVRDWWDDLHSKPTSRGKIVWLGHNPAGRRGSRNIRLYLCVWENPQPGKKVAAIDLISTMTTAGSPFCVAITAEGVADAVGGR
jgi:peroxiredoxin